MKTKIKNTILITIVSIISAVVPAIIFNKYLEASIFFACHWLIREQFSKQYHHIIPAICRTITACVMFFGISFVLPLELSLLSAIPICYFISWVGFIKKNGDDFEIKCDELEVRIAEQQAQISALQLKASQEAQNAYLLSQLKPCPSAAYIVPNPNCCYDYTVTKNNSCGCY